MNPEQRARPYRILVKVIILSLVVGLMSSCSSGPRKVDRSSHTVSKVSDSWVQVRSKPPTWFPRGVAADHPTGSRSGSWIDTEDSQGTRFFIPHHGLPGGLRKSLKDEALAARHPARAREMGVKAATKDVGAGAVGIFGLLLMGVAKAIAGMGV